jgi:NADH-quinone oxidoreductase subunit A
LPVTYWPVAAFFLLALGFGLVALALNRLIAPPRPNPRKYATYESGVLPIGVAQQRFNIRFYVVAMLFVLFDIEAVFLYPWAVVLDRIGLYALIEMVLFIFLLILAYVYALRKKALDWDERSNL